MKQIDPISLKEKIDNEEDFQLVDIRDEYEFEICCIGGDKINMYSMVDNLEKISKDKDVIIYCRTGTRCINLWACANVFKEKVDETIKIGTEAGYDLDHLRPVLDAIRSSSS